MRQRVWVIHTARFLSSLEDSAVSLVWKNCRFQMVVSTKWSRHLLETLNIPSWIRNVLKQTMFPPVSSLYPCFQMWCFHTSFHCLDLHPGRIADPSLCVFLLSPIPSDWNSSVYKWEHLISEMLYIVLTIYIVLLYSIEFILLYHYNYFMYIVYVCHKISIIIHGVCT